MKPAVQRGSEQSHRTSFLTGHILWQDRIEKERKTDHRYLSSWSRQYRKHPPEHLQKWSQAVKGEQTKPTDTQLAPLRSRWFQLPGQAGPASSKGTI